MKWFITVLVLSVVLIAGCTQNNTSSTVNDTKISNNQTSASVIENETEQPTNLTESTEELIDTLDVLKFILGIKVNCSKPDYFNHSFINVSLKESKTLVWDSSLNEGRIDSILYELRNDGCTSLTPIYRVAVIFNNEVIYIDDEYRDFTFTSTKNEIYPGDSIIGESLHIKNNNEPLIVHDKGTYTVYVVVHDNKTTDIVGVDKVDLEMK